MSGNSDPRFASKPKRGRKYRYVRRADRATAGMVYFIRAGDDGPIKIGRVGSTMMLGVHQRLETLQIGHHEKLHLVGVLPGALYEGIIHAHFKDLRIRGEWFSPTAELLDFINDPHIERIMPDDFERPDEPPIRHKGKFVPWGLCDNCYKHLNVEDEDAGDGMLCGLCLCKFEDLELDPEAYEEVPEAA